MLAALRAARERRRRGAGRGVLGVDVIRPVAARTARSGRARRTLGAIRRLVLGSAHARRALLRRPAGRRTHRGARPCRPSAGARSAGRDRALHRVVAGDPTPRALDRAEPRQHDPDVASRDLVRGAGRARAPRRTRTGAGSRSTSPMAAPAVEARSIAWRYEIEVRRSVRFGPDDRAVITPLGYVDVSGVARARADRLRSARARAIPDCLDA